MRAGVYAVLALSPSFALSAHLARSFFRSALSPAFGSAPDAPRGTLDVSAGVEPLAGKFDAELGKYRLLLLLSPA